MIAILLRASRLIRRQLMEQSWNAEGAVLTNFETRIIIKPRLVAVRDNPGKMSAY